MGYFFRTFWTLLFCFFVLQPLVSQTIRYVKQGSSGDGTSWETAYGDLQNALQNANFGDQVWVAEGVYYPVSCTFCSQDQRSTSFEIPTGVKVFGGFAGTETSIEMRTSGHLSILDGDINQDNTKTNNSFNIVYIKDASNETQLDGFTLRNAYAEFSNVAAGSYSNSGGGVYIEKTRKDEITGPTISNCIFTNNEVFGIGAGIFMDGDAGWLAVTVENCQFLNNIAESGGPGIHSKSDFGGLVNSRVINCHFEDNETQNRGGAIFNLGFRGENNMILQGCTFKNNTSAKDAGALGLDIELGEGSLLLERCEFVGNTAADGGAIYIDTKNGTTDFDLLSSRLDSNIAEFNGGAIYFHAIDAGKVDMDIAYSSFTQNDVSGNGGALYMDATNGEYFNQKLLGVKFNSNNANSNGGGVYWKADNGHINGDLLNVSFAQNDAFSGGGIYATASMDGDATNKLVNCTFFGNNGFNGGALFLTTSDGNGNANLHVVNSLFKDNSGFLGSAISRLTHAFPIIENSILDVADCDAAGSVPSGAQGSVTCQNNIFEAVEFEDETNLDLRPVTASAIDAAVNLALDTFEIESDADSLYRFDNLIADLGAFESNSGAIHEVQWDVIPESQASCDSVDFRIRFVARGNGHFDYVWLHDGEPIPEEDFRILEVKGGAEVAGVYQLRVVDAFDNEFISDSILVTITPPTDFTVSATSDKTALCQLDSLQLSASINGPALLYDKGWYKNGTLVSDQNDYWAKNIEPGDSFQFIATSDFECLTNDADSSAIFEPSVQLPDLPTITIKEPGRICEGVPKTLGVSTTFAGENPTYTWYRNGLRQVGSSAQKQFNTLRNTDEIYVTLESDEACVSETIVHSDTLNPNVIARIIPTLEIQTEDSVICQSQRANFFANVSNAGENPTIFWYAGDDLIAENTLEISYLDFVDGDSVYIEVYPNGECADTIPFRSNIITMDVRPVDAPNLQLIVDNETICNGQSVEASVTVQNLPTFYNLIWKLNGVPIIEDTLATVLEDIVDGDRLVVELQFSSICAPDGFFASNPITFEVLDSNSTTLEIEASSNTLCSNEAVQLKAVLSDGNNPDRVVWKRNGIVLPEYTQNVIILDDIKNGDIIVAETEAPSFCSVAKILTSNQINFTISSTVIPQVGIEGKDFSICRKDDFYLVAKTVNLGINGRVDWYVNDIKTGSGDTLFFEGISGDALVYIVGYPSISCPTQDSVVSAPIQITALDDIFASASIRLDAKEFCEDGVNRLKLEAIPENGGSNPAYKWYLNDRFTRITSDIFRLGNFVPSDEIFVEMTSNNTCVNPAGSIVTSDTLKIADIDCEIILPNEAFESEGTLLVFPNPTYGQITIQLPEQLKDVSISVFDMSGTLVKEVTDIKLDIKQLDISHLKAGMYYLHIQSESYQEVVKLVKM